MKKGALRGEIVTPTEWREYEALIEEAQIRRARTNLWAFCQYMDEGFFTDIKVHCRELALLSQSLVLKKSKKNRLFIAFPPRSGKSYTLTMVCAWALGKLPDRAIMRNCYGASLAYTISYDVRHIIRSDKFARVFPNVSLARDSTAIQSWRLEGFKTRPSYFGTGIGGDATGKGCDALAITDDPHKGIDDGKSPLMQRRAERWYYSVHVPRMESGCPEIIAATRWDKRDLPGRVLEKSPEQWIKYVVPALTPGGESFCPEIKTTEEYHKTKKETDAFIWLAEYMQDPQGAEGILMDEKELKYYRESELPGSPDATFMAVDTADEGKCFLSAVVVKKYNERFFIPDVIYTQEKIEHTWAQVAECIVRNKVEVAMFESNFGGKAYALKIKELLDAEKYYCEVLWSPSTTNKETRIIMKSGFIKERFHFLEVDQYEIGSHYWKFMEHFSSYNRLGNNEYSDANDSATIAADMAQGLLNKGGFYGVAAGDIK